MLAAILVYILAVISPGPNFILVSRFAAANSIITGIGAALGICIVGLIFSISSVVGLSVFLISFPNFGRVATIVGAIYLTYIAFLLLRGALKSHKQKDETDQALNGNFLRAFRMGIATNIINMKTIAFMISIFSALIANFPTKKEIILVIITCSLFEIIWYSMVSIFFGQGFIRKFYMKYNRIIDITLAVFIILFAINSTIDVPGQN